MRFDDIVKDDNVRFSRLGVKIGLLTIGFIILISLIGILTLPFRSGTTILENTFDGNNVVYNYEWFHNQYNKVQATQQKVNLAQEAIENFNSTHNMEDLGFTEQKRIEVIYTIESNKIVTVTV